MNFRRLKVSRFDFGELWKAGIIVEREAEGITITHVEGLSHFFGYYFHDKILPRVWLKDEASKPQG